MVLIAIMMIGSRGGRGVALAGNWSVATKQTSSTGMNCNPLLNSSLKSMLSRVVIDWAVLGG